MLRIVWYLKKKKGEGGDPKQRSNTVSDNRSGIKILTELFQSIYCFWKKNHHLKVAETSENNANLFLAVSVCEVINSSLCFFNLFFWYLLASAYWGYTYSGFVSCNKMKNSDISIKLQFLGGVHLLLKPLLLEVFMARMFWCRGLSMLYVKG